MSMGYIYVFNTLVRFNKDYSKKKVALRNLSKGLVPSTIHCLSVLQLKIPRTQRGNINYQRLPKSHLYIVASEKLTPSPTTSSFPEVNWCNCNQTPENGAPEGTIGREHRDGSLLSLIHDTCA